MQGISSRGKLTRVFGLGAEQSVAYGIDVDQCRAVEQADNTFAQGSHILPTRGGIKIFAKVLQYVPAVQFIFHSEDLECLALSFSSKRARGITASQRMKAGESSTHLHAQSPGNFRYVNPLRTVYAPAVFLEVCLHAQKAISRQPPDLRP